MAKIVLGIGTSHSPVLSLAPEMWEAYAQNDKRNPELLLPDGTNVTYDELLAHADPAIARAAVPEVFHDLHARAQRALATLQQALADAAPDTVVIISDDQDELLFDDNMPSLAIYWGESMKIVPRTFGNQASQVMRASAWGYGESEVDVPVDSALGKHLIGYLTNHDFDVAHMRYLRDEYGGAIGPAGYVNRVRTTAPKQQGMPHGFSFVVTRVMNGDIKPVLPVFQNTCYPPNQPTPRRSYLFGQAIRAGIEAWDQDRRVAVVASGGLSHFVVDEELDRKVLKALADKDAATLKSLPRARLDSATSETQNWIAAGGAAEHLDFKVVDYLPAYRTPAGTGGGWAFGLWQ